MAAIVIKGMRMIITRLTKDRGAPIRETRR